MNAKQILTAAVMASAFSAGANVVAHFPMDISGGRISETVSGDRFEVEGHFAPESVAGAVGDAMRFDGYTSKVNARIGNVIADASQATISLWVAVPSYPIVRIDEQTNVKVTIASCLDESARNGFGFFLGFDGKYSFRTYVGGWPVDINVDEPLPTYQWCNLVAVVYADAGVVKLYNNGELVGQSRCTGNYSLKAADFVMGQGPTDNYMGPFQLMAYNGLIDDIRVMDNALSESDIKSAKAENPANLDIPESRFANDILRPRFHGMPAAAWTNECHGMTWADGRFHLFFQKNADGPYMARLHWGHISSENLYDWREEKIAIAPGAPYDIKGCWSGCVFTDSEINGGKPTAIYTAVDYARASIAMATPDDAALLNWSKYDRNPIIANRPDGLSDDFRDPYFFRHNGNAYIIVGSSKNGVGTTTLHRYYPASNTWSNNGDLFFTGRNAAQAGRFWEMPTVTPMENGQWLFTATPLETSTGVRTLYWTGSIDADGHFQPASNFTTPKQVELISRDGFGLLSPTIYQHEGKTIALGIVPDKLGSEDNWNLGWAHCYSLPREWRLNDKGELLQKPYEGLAGMRGATTFSRRNFDLNGSVDLSPVSGRRIELLGEFEVGSTPFGFRVFKNAKASATILYNPNTGQLTCDFSRLARLINDGGVYNGVYTCSLPEFLRGGSIMKLNVFVDHSIVDIFVNDSWATSIRIFATDTDADGAEVYSVGGDVKVRSLDAWNLDGWSFGGIGDVAGNDKTIEFGIEGDRICFSSPLADDAQIGIFDIQGRMVYSRSLPAGTESVSTELDGHYVVSVLCCGKRENRTVRFGK
ncbi:MAG: GH32 C-terminal domain-containing protein [Muribaculaceae bacterium]|nr:GH32 C-terminal domain-containing protein [Muribaculaceae bacterium]